MTTNKKELKGPKVDSPKMTKTIHMTLTQEKQAEKRKNSQSDIMEMLSGMNEDWKQLREKLKGEVKGIKEEIITSEQKASERFDKLEEDVKEMSQNLKLTQKKVSKKEKEIVRLKTERRKQENKTKLVEEDMRLERQHYDLQTKLEMERLAILYKNSKLPRRKRGGDKKENTGLDNG